MPSIRLPEHDGQIECVAQSKDGRNDSVKFYLKFHNGNGGGFIIPPISCTECNELKEPNIHVENGYDIHQGENVILKCSLFIPKAHSFFLIIFTSI